jgi:anionic cell wall polymer biosynthesis LytR-Cps2A-Psr (LCP) family protein
MTHAPPARAGRPSSGAAARLAALLAEFERREGERPADEPPVAPEPAPARARSTNGHARSALRERLAALAPAEPDLPPAVLVHEPAPIPAPAPAPGPEAGPATEEQPATRSRWRARALPIAMAVLIAAIPVLAVVGSRTVLDSRAGKVTQRNLDPAAPGYIAIVEPTPTALVIQRDPAGQPVSLTMLALGTGEAGGSVLFIPLDTNLVSPALFVDRIRTAFDQGGESALVSATSKLLGIGFDQVVTLDDADWAELVAPVSPISVENPIAITLGEVTLPQGPLDLPADQVAGYLASLVYGQDDLDRLDRQQLVWRAWLQAIASSGSADAVPTTTSGLGPFIRTLAAGTTSMATLDVVPAATFAPDGALAFEPQIEGILEQVTDAVPAPVSPGLGGRFSVRVLNGSDGEPIPTALLRELVKAGAQIDALGNDTEFGARETRIEYRSPRRQEAAETVRSVLGGGKIHLDAETNDPVDLVIVLGRDTLEDFAGG